MSRFNNLRRVSAAIAAIVITLPIFALNLQSVVALAGSDFRAAQIIDDAIFYDNTRMAAPDIQNFLNSKVPTCDTNGSQIYSGSTTRAQYSASKGVSTPFICLKDYSQDVPAMAADQFCLAVNAGHLTAAQIIETAADACGISPMVILTTLQKEQSFITDDWPWPVQYKAAMGYGCPDTSSCDPAYSDFFKQVYYGARQMQRYRQQPQLFGYQAGRSNYIQYNPNAGCSGSQVQIVTSSTAGLYDYTPYQPNQAALNNLYGTGDGCSSYGNRNFWRIYSDWFGSPLTGRCFNGNTSVNADVLFHTYGNSKADTADFMIYSGSGSGCVESHIWNRDFSNWQAHIASNQPGITYPDGQVVFGNLDGSGYDYPVLFGLRNTGGGMIESHVWSRDLRNYIAHAASNMPAVNPADDQIMMGDLNGDGKDEPILVAYRNTGSGMIEFHGWAGGMQGWLYHIATNMPAVDPSANTVAFADLDGAGHDQAILIALNNTGSGRIEFHVWNPGQWSWRDHIASNMPQINPADGKVAFADLNGDKKDKAVLVGLHHTGSGMIEFHVWNHGFTSWQSHYASNQPAL